MLLYIQVRTEKKCAVCAAHLETAIKKSRGQRQLSCVQTMVYESINICIVAAAGLTKDTDNHTA